MKERTIRSIVSAEGVGLHSKKKGQIILYPADEGTGIVFDDLDTGYRVEATIENVVDDRRAITLRSNKAFVLTPEHLLSALYAMGITNVIIKYKNEIPILDGSAAPFIELIKKAGIVEQQRERAIYKIENPIYIKNNDKIALALPSSSFRIRYLIDYPNTYIGSQCYDFLFDERVFIEDISRAKTFVLYEDIENLKKSGLSLGGSLENAIVVKGNRILGKMSLEREFVKHKIVDFLGDISLLGKFLIGDFILIKAGHKLHLELVRKLKGAGGI